MGRKKRYHDEDPGVDRKPAPYSGAVRHFWQNVDAVLLVNVEASHGVHDDAAVAE